MKSIYRYIILWLCAHLLVAAFSAPLVFVQYELKKEFIIKELCENREKPELNCLGKCYLKKQLEANTADMAVETIPPFYFISPAPTVAITIISLPAPAVARHWYQFNNNLVAHGFAALPEQPPQQA